MAVELEELFRKSVGMTIGVLAIDVYLGELDLSGAIGNSPAF